MEVIRGPQHSVFPMEDATRVGEARRHAATLALRAGMDDVQAGRVALLVTELGNNLVKHATGGRLLLALFAEQAQVEIVAIDRGPGLADPALSLSDGFSTGGTPGTGLGAARRLADEFHLHSRVPDGTVIVARVRARAQADRARPALCYAGISVALDGELVCGDGWAVALDGDRGAVLVADGLGHGPDAAEAAQAALDVFEAQPLAEPAALVAAMHGRLRATRGAAVSVIQLDTAADSVRFCGAGNVAARLLSGGMDKTVLTQHGTAGVQIRTPEETRQPWPAHALVVVHSDGLASRWSPERLLPVLGRDPLLAAAILWRDHARGRDDATVVVVRRTD